ncbi:MAG: hypothetical protein O4752_09935 [Trichodesmium sp. St4_bin8_1]|nr:hypothetical protein [Trichodesmium sp. St4_bin8_1]
MSKKIDVQPVRSSKIKVEVKDILQNSLGKNSQVGLNFDSDGGDRHFDSDGGDRHH